MHKNAFLLIEVLIALLVFSIFVLFIGRYQIVCLQIKDEAVKRNLALQKGINFLQSGNEKDANVNIKKILYANELALIASNLKNILGKNLRLDPAEFKADKIEVSFKTLNGKQGRIEIISV